MGFPGQVPILGFAGSVWGKGLYRKECVLVSEGIIAPAGIMAPSYRDILGCMELSGDIYES